jgi:hypothetical protein
MAADDLPPDADALYGLPLEEFVAERGVVAKRLRAAGDREAATRVAALRKPSVAAWTLNQLVRSRAADVAAFAQAAERLHAAQSALLEGTGSPAELRGATEAERAAVARLVEVARGLFPGGREPGESTLERVAATLHAAATDATVRAEVLSGRLLAEREAAGFGGLDIMAVAAPARPPTRGRSRKGRAGGARRTREDAAQAREEAAAREAAERAAREAAERERERSERRAALQTALDEAVTERERAERALEAARAEERRRRAALDEAG